MDRLDDATVRKQTNKQKKTQILAIQYNKGLFCLHML